MANKHGCKKEPCSCEIRTYLLVGFLMLLIFGLEFYGGWRSHSLALLSDSFHVLSDVLSVAVSIIVAILAVVYHKSESETGATRSFGGYASAVLLGVVAVWILFEAWNRFRNPQSIVTGIMIWIAAVGTFGNFLQHQILHRAGHAASKTITHSFLDTHVLSDMFQSIAVVVAGITIRFSGQRFYFIDPALSAVVAGWMIIQTVKMFKMSGRKDYN